jgi:hypothetical protein
LLNAECSRKSGTLSWERVHHFEFGLSRVLIINHHHPPVLKARASTTHAMPGYHFVKEKKKKKSLRDEDSAPSH